MEKNAKYACGLLQCLDGALERECDLRKLKFVRHVVG